MLAPPRVLKAPILAGSPVRAPLPKPLPGRTAERAAPAPLPCHSAGVPSGLPRINPGTGPAAPGAQHPGPAPEGAPCERAGPGPSPRHPRGFTSSFGLRRPPSAPRGRPILPGPPAGPVPLTLGRELPDAVDELLQGRRHLGGSRRGRAR